MFCAMGFVRSSSLFHSPICIRYRICMCVSARMALISKWQNRRNCAIILAIYVLAYAKQKAFFPIYVLLGNSNSRSVFSTRSIGVACSIWFNNIISNHFFRRVSVSLQRQNYCRLKKRWPMKLLLLPQATNTSMSVCAIFISFFVYSSYFSRFQFNFFGAPACEPQFFSAHNIFSLFSLESAQYQTEYYFSLPRC